MADDVTILVVRFAVLGIVFLFLFTVLRTQWRELTRARPIRAGSATQESAILYVVQPGKTGLRSGDPFELEPSTTIGRVEGNNVVLDEETVSSRHAAVEFHDGRWWIRDLGSTNGTFLNNEAVDGQGQLEPGDLIQVGGVRLQFAASRPTRR
ncbi:MAG TPA: FHA domain-containing protein [Dehalococcoidia bacterium]|jgi:pSer/pThr/pTyr-binding forkhead associated (FHA) protein|nr:FHA domain-containing protein [Dehalococcoidia bacterium]